MIKRAGAAVLILAALAVGGAVPAPAQEGIVAVKVVSPAETLKPGETQPMALEITIAAPYHINAEVPSEAYLIGTTVTFTPEAGLNIGKLVFPPAETIKLGFSETPLAVYAGTVKVGFEVTLDKDYAESQAVVEGKVGYQACNDQTCLAPEEAAFARAFPLAGAPKTESLAPGPGEGSAPAAKPAPSAKPDQAGPSKAAAPRAAEPAKPADPFAGKSLPLIFVLVFLGGLGLNLTPCVYPLIPITISYFGGQAQGKKGGMALHAVLYVGGMAVTYSALGVAAALAGSLFGAALQYPPVLVFIALVMIALAMSMFDVYELRMPAFLNRLAGSQQKGYFGTLVMGLTVGIVAAPCIGPFVLGLLTFVGDRGSVLLGFSLFFVLALGLGLPFIFLGIFSGSLSRLPRSGGWMVWVRKIFGFILVAMAIYFLEPLFPGPLLYTLALAATMFFAGVYLGWLEPSAAPGKAFRYVRTWTGIAFFAAAAFVADSGIKGYINAERAGEPGGLTAAIAWETYSEEMLAEAQRSGKPVFIDSYADWCIPCKEMDSRTFNQPEVIIASRAFVMLKADLTRRSGPVEAFYKKYGIRGVPTLIFLDPDGTEFPELRGTGYEPKDVFLKKMDRALELARGD